LTTIIVDQALALVRQLPPRERVRLIALIAQDIAAEPPSALLMNWPPVGVTVQFPTVSRESISLLRGGTWDADLPLRREELYDDRGRA
jgi:hypothetical protein